MAMTGLAMGIALALVQDGGRSAPVYPEVPIALDPLAPLPEPLAIPDLPDEGPRVAGGEDDATVLPEPTASRAPNEVPPAAAPATAAAPSAVTCQTRSFVLPMVLQAPDGRTRETKVTLCAENDDPAAYATMLRSARDKLLFDEHFTLASRSAMVDAIDAELARRGLMRPLVETPLPPGR